MKLDSDFFDYEKNLSNMINKNKIEIYKSPNRGSVLRKKSEEKLYHYDLENEQLVFQTKNKIYDIKKADSLSVLEGRRRGYSQRVKRNNETDFIISDIDPKDEASDSRTLYNGKPKQKGYSFKRGNSLIRLNSLKRNTNRFKKKKVTFKNRFVNVIEVESYKKYNLNEELYDRADAKCTCFIY